MTERLALEIILVLSTLSQLAAAAVAFRLIVVTGRALAWILVSLGLLCMVFRRVLPLYLLLVNQTGEVDLPAELLGLLVSLFMLAGMLLIGGLFKSIGRAKEKMELASRRLQESSAAGRIALWDWDIVAGTIDWSNLVDDMLRFPPNGFPRTYRAWEARIHPDDLDSVQQAIRRNFESNAPYDVTYRIQRADGSYAWWHDVGHVARDRNGSPISMGGACVDVTEQKQRDEEYGMIVQTAMDGFFIASARTGRLLDVNEAYCRFVGYTRAELLSKRIADLDMTESASALAQQLQRVVRVGRDRFETRHRCKDGRIVELAVSVDYLPSTNRICAFLSDITERKRNEAALHERLVEIERFNRFSTAREHRMIELKQQINRLAQEAGRPPPYAGDPDDPDAIQPQALVPLSAPPVLLPQEPEHPAPPVNVTLANVLDRRQLQSLLENFSSAVGISSSIIDTQGTVFVGANWQPICTAFHRIDERAWTRCVESDTVLATRLQEGKPYALFTCRNGLTEAAVPIVVENRTIGNLFLNQFLLEPPDLAFFRRQAANFGFDEAAYLAALARVPVVSREKLQPLLGVITSFASLLGEIGEDHLREQRNAIDSRQTNEEMHQQREAALNLAQDAIEARRALEASEEALRQNRDMLARILDTVPQAVLWKDRNSVYLGCNQVFAHSVCLASPEEVVGKTTFDIFPNREQAERYLVDDREVMENNWPKRHIVEHVERANGKQYWTDTTKLPLVDKDGQVYGVLAVFEDISARMEMEESLRESEERYRALFDTANDAIFLMEKDRFIECNARTLSMYDCTREQIVGQTPYRYSPPRQPDGRDSQEKAQEKIQAALAGQPQCFDWKHIRYDGTPFDAEVSLNCIVTHGRTLLQAVVRDITARKEADEQLRAQEARHRLALETVAAGEWELELPSLEARRSNQHARIFGYEPPLPPWSLAAMLGHVVLEDRPRVEQSVRESIRLGHDVDFECRIQRCDGELRWIWARGQHVCDKAGRPVRIAGLVIDITGRRKNEQALLGQLEELQRWQAVMIGREQLAMELKHEINALHLRLGEPVRYPSAAEGQGSASPS